MRSASLDPSRRLDLYFRINRNGDLTIPVYGSDGLAFSLVYDDFSVSIKRNAGDRLDIITLTVGHGITLSGNEIQIDLTADQTQITEGEYYWELLNVDENETWLCGKALFHNGVFDSQNDDISVSLVSHEVVNIYLNN